VPRTRHRSISATRARAQRGQRQCCDSRRIDADLFKCALKRVVDLFSFFSFKPTHLRAKASRRHDDRTETGWKKGRSEGGGGQVVAQTARGVIKFNSRLMSPRSRSTCRRTVFSPVSRHFSFPPLPENVIAVICCLVTVRV